jgi:hypothetical protein
MRINDYSAEFGALGHCQHSRVVGCLLRLSCSWKRHLYYNDQQHHFTISGLGAGGMGGQKISATGKVYNLNNLSSFSGTYRGVSRGLTLIEGKMHAKLTNGNGVTMYLAGETEGVASSMGVQAFEVNLTD